MIVQYFSTWPNKNLVFRATNLKTLGRVGRNTSVHCILFELLETFITHIDLVKYTNDKSKLLYQMLQ